MRIEPTAAPSFNDTRRQAAPYAASRAEPVRHEAARHEPVREPVRAERAPEQAPVVPSFQSAAPAVTVPVARVPEPVIHVAEERNLAPIIDPWVEEFESDRSRRPAAAQDQGDLYMDRGQPAPESDYREPAYEDRDHRKSGWSLFGSKKPSRPQASYAPQQSSPQMRPTSSAQPTEQQPGHVEDDLEIPSFLRRLAN